MAKAANISSQAPQYYPQPGANVQPTIVVDADGNDDGWKDTIKWIALALALTGVTFLVLRKGVWKIQTNKEQNKSTIVGNAQTNAKAMKMAFDNDGWPGTDEVAVREIMRSLKSRKDYDDMVKSYQKNYHRNLNKDLESELTSAEYQEMLYILATKPGTPQGEKQVTLYEAWARRLYNAMSEYYIGMFPSTDEDAIYAVFDEIPNYESWKKTKEAYKRIYHGASLYDDLCGDLWYWEVDELIAKLKKK